MKSASELAISAKPVLLRQDSQEATFHVDHIVPRSRSGATTLDNLLSLVSVALPAQQPAIATVIRELEISFLCTTLALTTGTTMSHSPMMSRRMVEIAEQLDQVLVLLETAD